MKTPLQKSALILLTLSIPAAAGLVGDWNIEESAGPTTEQVSLVSSDALRPGVTWSTTDTPGPASTASLQFDGSGDGNFANSARLGLNRNATDLGINGSGAKTVVAWIKTTRADKRYFWGWSPGNGLVPGGDLRLGIEDNGKLRFEVSSGFTRYDTLALNDGNWHMVAVIIEAGDGVDDVGFYIDGNLVTPTANNSQLINTSGTGVGGDFTPNEFFFASGGNSANQLWIGGLDDFRVYDTALNETELDAIRDAMAVAPPPTLVWNNAAADGLWNTSSVNWDNGTTDVAFTDGDKVRFEDLAGSTEDVAVTGTVAPQILTLDTFATDYTFTGAGTIGGSGPVTALGGGFTTFSNTGGITTTGTLNVSEQSWVALETQASPSSTTIGGASVIELLDGGSITGPIANSGTLLDSSTTGILTLGGVISGSGALIKDGASTLVLDAVNTFTGNVTIDSGVLRLAPGTGKLYQTGAFFGQQNVTNIAINGGIFETWNWNYGDANALSQLRNNYGQILLNGGTIRFTESFSSLRAFTVGANGGTLEAPAGITHTKQAGTTGGNNIIRFAADSTLTLSGVGDIVIEDDLGAYGATGFSIAKTGTGTLTLSGTNTYTGTTTVSGGTLAIDGTALADGTSLVIDGGVVQATGTEIVGTLFFGTEQKAAGTWGATGSGAANIDNTRFAGTAGVIDVTTGPGLAYTTWSAANANGDGPDLDSDGDGVPNGVEFLMGETGSSFTPTPSLVNGTVTWPKDPTALATWVIETSTNLQDEVTPGDGGWTTATTGVVDNGSSIEFTPASGAAKLFIRLRVLVP